jgi:hypothetical protein
MLTGPVEPKVNKFSGKIYGSKALQAEGVPTVALISLGNLRPDGTIIYPSEPTLAYSPEIDEYVVQPGDILFRGRGYLGSDQVAVAAFVDRELHEQALRQLRGSAPQVCFAYNSSLLRIRIGSFGSTNIPSLDPEYLAAYINSPEAQRHLSKHMKSGLISGVNKSDLLGFPISLPSIARQKLLVQLMRTESEHARTAARLTECYSALVTHALSQS